MRLAQNPALDALCGEYLLGTLRGAARRRFERALREESLVALRLRQWQQMAPRYSPTVEVQPSAAVWKRLEHELNLARYRTPWHRKLAFWRGLAAATTAALAIGIGIQTLRPVPEPALTQIAELEGKAEASKVSAALSPEGDILKLNAFRPTHAGPAQSYELWLLPAAGGAPVSLAVLGTLDARVVLPPPHARAVRGGGKLAVSVEPAGGSPTGGPTGPVILVGQIKL